jgi:beta-galactosidase
LYRRNIHVDFAHPEADLSPYRLVIAPHLYLSSDIAAQNIERYVVEGGALWMNFFSGIVDSNEHVRLGGYPAPFRRLLGLWVEEFAAYGESDQNRVETDDGQQYACDFWTELIHLEGAEKIAWFGEDYLAGSPAVTRHAFGKGSGYYLGTSLDQAGLSWLVERICRETGVQGLAGLPEGVEAVRRCDGEQEFLFLLNFSGKPARVNLPQLNIPANGSDLLTGNTVDGEILLEPAGVAVIRI